MGDKVPVATTETRREDAELVRAAQAGGKRAFEELVERHFGMVYTIAYSRLGHRETAEDLAQEVFLRAYLYLDRLQIPDRFAGWLVRVTHNLANDWMRNRRRASGLVPMVSMEEVRQDVPDEGGKKGPEKMHLEEQDKAVRDAIFALPTDLREIVMLHFAEGLSQKEIADRLEVHPATIGRRVKRALVRMKSSLEPILRESAPALRPPPTATLRAIALLGATAALSTNAKATLAEAAGGMAWFSSVMLSGSGGVSAGGTFGSLKTIGTAIITGGKIMGVGKGIAALVVAAALTAGGVHYLGKDKGPDKAEADVAETSADAAARLEQLGAVVDVRTSQDGEQYLEVKMLGPGYQREWKGGREGFKHLAALDNLRSLRVQDVDQFTDDEMPYLKRLPSLRSLYLVRTQVTDDGLARLKDLAGLEFLGIISNKLTDRALAHISGLRKLKSLRLDDSRISDKGLRKLKEDHVLDGLEFLVLSGTKITDAGLEHLDGLGNLKSLYLRDTQVTDRGLEQLSRLPRLEKLILSNTRVSDAGLTHLADLKDLWLLYLDNARITDRGVQQLTGLAKLSYLGLSGTAVTNAGLVHLAKLTKLEELGLGDCRVSDAGLQHLKGLTLLKTLYLNDTDVGPDGYAEIRRALPSCEIYGESPGK